MQLDVYVDDITISVYGPDDSTVFHLLILAAEDMARVIHDQLRCSIALSKAAVLASSDALLGRLRERLGTLAGNETVVAANLGIDFSAGRTDGSSRLPRKKARLQQGALRKPRLASLRKLVGGRVASCVFAAGILPSMVYGVEVHGVDDREWKLLQSVATTGLVNSVAGRSMSATRLLKGDSTARAAFGPAAKWQQQVWRAVNSPHRARVGLDELTSAWEDVRLSDSHSWYDPLGFANWDGIRGPIGATSLTLERFHWTVQSPTVWIDDIGVTRDLKEYSPKMFRTFLTDSAFRLMEAQVCDSIGDPSMAGHRACMDVVRKYVRSSKHEAPAKAAVAAAATNVVWTRARAFNSGYALDDTSCPMCGLFQDTLHHRIWHCCHPDVVAARRKAAKH